MAGDGHCARFPTLHYIDLPRRCATIVLPTPGAAISISSHHTAVRPALRVLQVVTGDPLWHKVRDADREEVRRGVGIARLDGAPLALDLRRYLVGAGPQAVDIPPQLLVFLR